MSGLIALSNVIEDFRQADGTMNAGGTLEFFENLTLTAKDVYNGYGSSTPLSNPLQLDAGGFEPGVWLGSGVYRIRCRGPAPSYPSVLGPVIWTKDNINVTSAAVAQPGNFIVNGSFEEGDDGTGTGAPNGWALTTYVGSTFALDSTDTTHGAWSAKCTSVGNGGATLITTSYTACSVSDAVVWKLRLKSSVADVRNVVSLQWYDSALGLLSSTSVYDDSATNPTSWTVKSGVATPPANAKFYKVTLIGCSPADVTSGSTWFDGVEFGTTPRQETANTWSGTQTMSGTVNLTGTVNLASGQLIFPATQVPSANPNTLDDYEESTTLTLDLLFGGANVGMTYTTRSGAYIKIGKLVFFNAYILLNAKGSSTGDVTLSGLPFDGGQQTPVTLTLSGVSFADSPYALITSATGIGLYEITNAGVVSTLTDANVSAGALIRVAGCYPATA